METEIRYIERSEIKTSYKDKCNENKNTSYIVEWNEKDLSNTCWNDNTKNQIYMKPCEYNEQTTTKFIDLPNLTNL